MDRQIRILLADGNEEFCGRLKQTLEEDGRFAVVGVAGDGVRACELMQSCHPDVLALVWGDRIFEKCGIGRDEGGDGGKTLEIRGKRRLPARDRGANYQQS